jgi:hypothetical protein
MLQVRNERPPITANTPRELVEIIERCWHPMPQKRPLFQELKTTFAEIAKVEPRTPYLSPSPPSAPSLAPSLATLSSVSVLSVEIGLR